MTALRRPAAGATLALVVALAGLTGGATPAGAHAAPARHRVRRPSVGALRRLGRAVTAEATGTFHALYSVAEQGAVPQILVVAQAPPDSLVQLGAGELVDTGQGTYYCSTLAGVSDCGQGPASGPLADLGALIRPAEALKVLRLAESALSAGGGRGGTGSAGRGNRLTFSRRTFAGVGSTCITTQAAGTTTTLCLSAGGVLTALSAAGVVVILDGFGRRVTPGLFQLPPGATVESEPPLPATTPATG